MSMGRLWWSPLVALLVGLVVLVALGGAAGPPSEAAQATPPAPATVQRGAGRVGLSPTLLGDINGDGLVDIRDYGLWRQAFGAIDCGNPADLNGDCIVDIQDYGIWRQNFGQTGPTATNTPSATSTPTAVATSQTLIFPVVGAATWTVPAGITSATFDVFGAQGGAGNSGANAGGRGGGARVTLAVAPGTTYQINVGGSGTGPVAVAGSGGGASDV